MSGEEGSVEWKLRRLADRLKLPDALRQVVYDAIVAHVERPLTVKPLLLRGPAISALSLDVTEAIYNALPAGRTHVDERARIADVLREFDEADVVELKVYYRVTPRFIADVRTLLQESA